MLCRKRQADANSCGRRISTLDLERIGSGRIVAAVLRERTQRFGTGTRLARACKNPKAASGGPIHVRLTLGNSKVPALRIFCPHKAGSLAIPPMTRTGPESVLWYRLDLQCAAPAVSAQALLIWLTKG